MKSVLIAITDAPAGGKSKEKKKKGSSFQTVSALHRVRKQTV